RAGVRYVRYDPAFRTELVRSGAFVSGAAGLWALLPAIACESADRGPAGYGLMLGSLGAGAVIGTLLFLEVRRGPSADVIVSARLGILDMRAQAGVIRALRSDTPPSAVAS